MLLDGLLTGGTGHDALLMTPKGCNSTVERQRPEEYGNGELKGEVETSRREYGKVRDWFFYVHKQEKGAGWAE